MRTLLTLALLGIVIAACSSQPSTEATRTEVKQDSPGVANIAPEGKFTEEVPPGKADSSVPIVTVNPSVIIVTSVQGNASTPSAPNSLSTENWQTFTSSTLGVTLDYPLDWSVAEKTNGVTFTSPNGATIQMKADTANLDNNEFKIGNHYCSSRTNQYDLTADICVDTTSFIYTAKFSLQKADGSTHWVTLETETRSVRDVFEAIFNSVRTTN